jgi:Immunity protein 35
MKMSLDKAKVLAEEAVAALGSASGDDFVLIYDKAIEVNEGWVFFYNTREFIETGNFTSRLAGNGPVFVNRNGVVRYLPSAAPWDIAISK